jgi:5-(carboxyamino)imidazole ribonucleotide synthase
MQKTGILGGGQLGRMLLQQAANYPVETYILENDPECPAAHLCHHFIRGDIRSYDDVYNFGKNLDAITIEIESVNVEALEKLESEGVKVYPQPAILRLIKNKILQKEFYKNHDIPTADYIVVQNKNDLHQEAAFLPAVNKIAEGGYDGRGVAILKSTGDINSGFDAPGILEKLITIHKEVSVIIAIGDNKQTAFYPPVEMVFDPVLNLLDYQVCPADVPQNTLWQIEAIAMKVAKALRSPGLFAVEMLVDPNQVVYVNETAPRVHNSGHHTIEANFCSQYDMLWRILLGYPLGNTAIIKYSALVNIIGEKDYSGDALFEGLTETLGMPNTYIHLYGKKQTRPGRKMGHVTLMGDYPRELIRNALVVKSQLRVIS